MKKWDLNTQEYTELCEAFSEELSLGGNWVYVGLKSVPNFGNCHFCNGHSGNSIYKIEFYFETGEVRIFMNSIDSDEITEVSNPNITGYYLSNEFVRSHMSTWASKKLSSFQELVDFGIYELKDYQELKIRLHDLILE